MTAKEYLRQYEYAQQRADMCRREYETEMLKIDAIGSTLAGDGQPHGTGISRKTEDKAIRLADKAMKWKEAELEAIAKRQQVFELIYDIPGIEGEILIERYVNLRKWEDICVIIHLSWRQTHRLHAKALAIVSAKMA